MKVIVVGSGGREHALAYQIAKEAEVVAAPGNPGIAEVARCAPVAPTDFEGLVSLARAEAADLVVVGPEDPLIGGLADRLRAAGIDVFGPGADGAALEGSKAFSKELMRDAGIPTAEFAVFSEAVEARRYAESRFTAGRGVVVKASGAALGKGVVVTSSPGEAREAIDSMLVDKAFGAAGETIVVEDRLNGPEFSLLTLCSDMGTWSLPVAQDYKRALDGDRGPNTGGMGTYSPVKWVTPDVVRQTEERVVKPALEALRRRGVAYRGVLFSGLMLHDGEPHCLEFNVRFGDPETQSIMLRLGSGFVDALLACAQGRAIPPVEVLDNAAVTVVLASGGYPGSYVKGMPVSIGEVPAGVQIFHAGTALLHSNLVTSGGRVFAVTAGADTVGEARDLAYLGASRIEFEGKQMRSDIAQLT